MAQLLGQAGVDPCRVHLDEESTDTFQSVVATAEFIRRQCLQRCVVCSDRYHLGRIRLLLTLIGIPATGAPTARGRDGTPLWYWQKMRIREVLATIFDVVIMLRRRRSIMASLASGAESRP